MEDNYDFEADMDSHVQQEMEDEGRATAEANAQGEAEAQAQLAELEAEAKEKHCYYYNKDDETSCQNIVIAGAKHDPFCGEECHTRYSDENYKEKPKSRFERFLKEGSKMLKDENNNI